MPAWGIAPRVQSFQSYHIWERALKARLNRHGDNNGIEQRMNRAFSAAFWGVLFPGAFPQAAK